MRKLLYFKPNFIDMVNTWRSAQPDLPSFSQAIVRLVMVALDPALPRK